MNTCSRCFYSVPIGTQAHSDSFIGPCSNGHQLSSVQPGYIYIKGWRPSSDISPVPPRRLTFKIMHYGIIIQSSPSCEFRCIIYLHRILYISVFYLLLMNFIWLYNFVNVILRGTKFHLLFLGHPAILRNSIVYFGRQSERLKDITSFNDLICKLQVIQRWKKILRYSDFSLSGEFCKTTFEMSRMIPR